MKRQILFITLFVILNFIFIACDKNENTNLKNGSVELFLLDSYKTISGTNHQIDERTIVTKAKALVPYSDFLSYNPGTNTFKISDAAKETLKSMEYPVYGIPFAIKANNVVIYTGYFWPGYSSASCDWVVIDPMALLTGNDLRVELGYPSLSEGQIIPDHRNDPQILNTFASDDKLIK